jgi:hypothetical protein
VGFGWRGERGERAAQAEGLDLRAFEGVLEGDGGGGGQAVGVEGGG